MSLLLQSLAGLETAGAVQSNQRLTLITAGGLVNVNWGTLASAVSAPLEARLTALEGGAGSAQPSIWPSQRTITLTGVITGSVALDGSVNVSLATSIADASLSIAKTNGLQSTLDTLTTGVGNRWGTGMTTGPNPSSYAGDLNALAGAVFVRTTAAATSLPGPAATLYTVLANGQINYGNQLAFGTDTLAFRTQGAGAWTTWRNLWHSGNLDPSNLLLKTDTASASSKLATARTFALTGAVTATGVQFDGSQNVTLNTSIVDGSIAIASVTGLASALATKVEQFGVLPNQSLNSSGTTGMYGQNLTARATLANNYPVAGATGILNVTQQTGYIEQEYITTTNQHWRRIYDNNTWSAWSRIWGSADFDPATKYDKTGGTISGAVTVTGALTSSGAVTGANFVSTLAYSSSRIFGLALARPAGLTSGITYGADYIGLATTVTAGAVNNELKITDSGNLLFKDKTIYHGGNFDPASPVDTSGQLRVGPSDADSVRFRKDGFFSVGGGAWKAMGAGDSTADPIFNSVTFGNSTGAKIETSLGGFDISAVNTTTGARTRLIFNYLGDLTVESGRMIVGSNVVWHAGNFDPNAKLGSTATAAAATKLATARTINGIAFDGTSNITIPSNVNPDDFVKVNQVAGSFTNADDLGGKLAHAVCGATALGTPLAYSTTWNLGSNGQRDGQFSWSYSDVRRLFFRSRKDTTGVWKAWDEVWTAGSFDPASKANVNNATFTGTTTNTTGSLRSQGWGGTANAGVLYLGADDSYIYRSGANFSFKNETGGYTAVLASGGTIWTANNFDPATKLNNRGSLGPGCATVSDWNNATDNGWYMGNGTANAPNNSSGWWLGTVTVHNGDWIQQEVHDFTAAGTPIKWRRWKRAGNWDPWTANLSVGGQLNADRIWSGWDGGIGGSISCSNWFRTSGETGIYFADFGGGWNMTDTTYIRAYNGKQVAAGDFVISSDLRLKKEIDPLEFRGRLRPVHFTLRKDGRRDMGFIADEVKALYPEAVGEIQCVEDGPLKGQMILQLSQQKLVAVVSHQVNQVEDDVVALRAELSALRQEIAELKNR